MEHWFQLIQDRLDLPWLGVSTDHVPFGLTGVDAAAWKTPVMEMVSDTHWRLTSDTADGLHATWQIVFFPDTRAWECWGEVQHRGVAPVRNIRDCLTLDFTIQLPAAFGQPWVRRVNGVQFLPQFFPPHDFGIVDRQLLHTPQVYVPFDLSGDENGRSSGEMLPCAIICDEQREHGLACFLEWSGLWRIRLQQAPQEYWALGATFPLGLQVGLTGLQIDLQPGQSLPLPRVLFTAFDGDLERGGNSLRRHIRRHVAPTLAGEEVLPPTSFNHWFAFDNNFTAESLKPAVDASAAVGLEYFCVDGGWFKNGFRSGIGNWSEGDPAKFPDGIRPFSEYVRSKGLKYGTWFEPEWANHESEIYRAHPEWFWPGPAESVGHKRGAFFNPDFHLMNFGLAEVQQWWLNRFVEAYETWGMRWVRWDYNQIPRPSWEMDVPAGQLGWRQIEHITGFYRTLDLIMEACPDLFIEQCASGGHRIDLGTIRRGHSFWMNDHTTHTDIVRVLQHGLNTVLPGSYANTNLCQNRHDFTDYDYLSHGAGGFGYSGKIWEAPPDELKRLTAAVARFKEYRPLLLGDYSRPTGQPARTSDYAKVVFEENGAAVTMEFNLEEEAGTASITMST